MTNLFTNIDISGKRLEGEDFKTYKLRRNIVNKVTKPGYPIYSQDRVISYRGTPVRPAFTRVVPASTEKDILKIFKEVGVNRVV